MEIAKKIKTARIKVELTQEHVADELQVSRQFQLENAKLIQILLVLLN